MIQAEPAPRHGRRSGLGLLKLETRQMRKTLIPVVMTMLLGAGAAAVPLLPAAQADERPAGAAWYARPSHIEGRIAFLKAELHITDAQTAQWNAVADALRDGDKTMRDAWAQLRPSGDA